VNRYVSDFGSQARTPVAVLSSRTSGARLITANRFVLGGAVLFGVVSPEILLPWVHNILARDSVVMFMGLHASFYASIVAIIIGHISLARFTVLPTIDAKAYVLPSFLMGYAAVLAALYASNMSFGHFHFFASFFIVVPWYLGVAIVRERIVKPHVAIIGTERSPLTAALTNVDWTVLDVPVLSRPASAIVVHSELGLASEWEHFIAQAVLQGIPVYDALHMREALTRRVDVTQMPHLSFGALLPALTYIRIKRVIDFLIAIPALIVAAPVIFAFCVAVRLESPGPAIFAQKRTGFRGETFTVYKIRSMVSGHGGTHFTKAGDVRITRIGAFIRKYRIDELPQIWNIIRGDMSWIGPRPEAISLANAYEASIPFYSYRHAVRPGISGWAAVHQGNVAEVDAATVKLQYDFFYIKYCSLWLDVLIVLMTLRTIATGFGSR
jgi:lipopolysaccharide/colanic/teichoic acid biosynthesis glycosyltransferase